jgi:hypothetical protein
MRHWRRRPVRVIRKHPPMRLRIRVFAAERPVVGRRLLGLRPPSAGAAAVLIRTILAFEKERG